ncbi:MAG: hypothetical protein U0528_01340 [Anaerolineae bacterium]
MLQGIQGVFRRIIYGKLESGKRIAENGLSQKADMAISTGIAT